MEISLKNKRTERLDKIIAENSDLSREKIGNLIKNKMCNVNNIIVTKKSQILSPGDLIILQLDTSISSKKNFTIDIHFYHNDEDIIVLEKPANVSTHGVNGNHENTLNGILIKEFPEIISVGDHDRPGIVHRLDKGTSVIMIVAKIQRAYNLLKKMILKRKIERIYTALVHGKPIKPKAIIDAPILRDPNNPLKRKIISGGRESKTLYSCKKYYSKFTLLEIKLFSGRMHQIRVHLSELGHPLVGDKMYGSSIAELDLKRPFLHSSKLSFKHPINKKMLFFESTIPEDLEKFSHSIER